jgi:hypothetical protein
MGEIRNDYNILAGKFGRRYYLEDGAWIGG